MNRDDYSTINFCHRNNFLGCQSCVLALPFYFILSNCFSELEVTCYRGYRLTTPPVHIETVEASLTRSHMVRCLLLACQLATARPPHGISVLQPVRSSVRGQREGDDMSRVRPSTLETVPSLDCDGSGELNLPC